MRLSTLACIVSLLLPLKVVICYEKDGRCYEPLQLVIALDASGSIDSSAWQTQVSSAKQVILANNVPTSDNEFAILSFTTNATVLQATTSNATEAIQTLNKLQMNSQDGHTYIDAAIHEAAKIFESQPVRIETRKKVFVLYTDGFMTYHNGEDVLVTLNPEVMKLNASNVTSFAVGIGQPINYVTLKNIASQVVTQHVIYGDGLGQLGETIKKSAEVPCVNKKGKEDKLTAKCGSLSIRRAGEGCYRDNQNAPRPLPDLLFSDRAEIDWDAWDSFVQPFVCKCAEESAKQQRKIFGLQYFGECWSSTANDTTYAKDGADPTECITNGYKPCNSTTPFCVGRQSHNFVYNIIGTN